MPALKNQLSDLIKVEGINTAVVVGRDGFVIGGVSNGGNMDMEEVGAIISTGIGTAEAMGSQLKVGALTQAMVECADGVVVMSFLGREAILACVAHSSANLGNVRYQIKKRSPEILASI